MNENLSILEGELGRQFAPVDRLSVNNQGGGESRWVVADFLDISTLTASENGLYLAAEEECDCYEEVEVEVSEELEEDDYRKITGKDSSLDPNNDYAVGLDENGNLTKEMIPAAIHIVVPPRKRKYAEGETIDFSGIHVYLMDGNNRRYVDESYPTGEIPFEELIFDPTIAGEDGSGSVIGEDEEHGIKAIRLTKIGEMEISKKAIYYLNGEYCIFQGQRSNSEKDIYITTYENEMFYASAENEQVWLNYYFPHGSGGPSKSTVSTFEPLGIKTEGTEFFFTFIPESTSDPRNYNVDGLTDKTIKCVVTVSWMRSDGEILEDTFEIEVGESGEPSPPQPDPWGGYADVSWGGHHYNLNRRIVPEVHYANGYLWQEGTSEYTVEQAASMGWLILIR